MHILRCMSSKFCVKFQRAPLKFHKNRTHTPQNMHFTGFYFYVCVTMSLNCDVISLSETGPWSAHCCAAFFAARLVPIRFDGLVMAECIARCAQMWVANRLRGPMFAAVARCMKQFAIRWYLPCQQCSTYKMYHIIRNDMECELTSVYHEIILHAEVSGHFCYYSSLSSGISIALTSKLCLLYYICVLTER